MDDVETSWVRRAKFSHTVYHRIDMSRLSSVPFTFEPLTLASAKTRAQPGTQNPKPNVPVTLEPRTLASVKSRPQPVTQNPKPDQHVFQVQRNPIINRERAISPHPQTKLSDSFKEAHSIQRRFSTPNPQRKDQDKFGKFFHRDCKECKAPRSKSPLMHLTSMKFHDKSRSRKEESPWAKYFDLGGGRVISVETVDDDHLVDLSKLFIGLRFAHGAHSQLYHGIYMDNPVAVKIIRVPDDDEKGDISCMLEKQFTREVTLLSRLHHQNVIKFLAACRKTPVFCIVTEYMSEGSLRAHLHKLEQKCIPLRKLISMALDIARGLEYIHSQGIIHRDLKPENILITNDFRLKIADFGIACEEACCDVLADDPGTYRWMAPEMIKRKHYGRKVDVYGFGLILWEFVTGTIPYQDMTPIQAAFAVVNKNLRPDIPRDCPLAMKALIEQCWSIQPEKRPDFWQIVKVLEEFDCSLARDGTLNLAQNLTCQDHKKGLRHWIHKLKANH